MFPYIVFLHFTYGKETVMYKLNDYNTWILLKWLKNFDMWPASL